MCVFLQDKCQINLFLGSSGKYAASSSTNLYTVVPGVISADLHKRYSTYIFSILNAPGDVSFVYTLIFLSTSPK